MSDSVNKEPLREKDEFLLIKYLDGECGLFERFLAKRLIQNNPSALDFVSSLKSLSKDFANTRTELESVNVDLWSRVERRIEQEEKAAFYLGSRVVSDVRTEVAPLWNRVGVGLGAGLLTACLAVFFSFGLSRNVVKEDFSVQPAGSEMVYQSIEPIKFKSFSAPLANEEVSFVSSQPFAGNSSLRDPSRVSSRIDWVRSHGRVKMIKSSEKKLPIIWVKRALPDGLPDTQLFDVESSENGSQPVILEQREPVSISISNKK